MDRLRDHLKILRHQSVIFKPVAKCERGSDSFREFTITGFSTTLSDIGWYIHACFPKSISQPEKFVPWKINGDFISEECKFVGLSPHMKILEILHKGF